jgi:hypothetical protein
VRLEDSLKEGFLLEQEVEVEVGVIVFTLQGFQDG